MNPVGSKENPARSVVRNGRSDREESTSEIKHLGGDWMGLTDKLRELIRVRIFPDVSQIDLSFYGREPSPNGVVYCQLRN
jgi:hypothetical protein